MDKLFNPLEKQIKLLDEQIMKYKAQLSNVEPGAKQILIRKMLVNVETRKKMCGFLLYFNRLRNLFQARKAAWKFDYVSIWARRAGTWRA